MSIFAFISQEQLDNLDEDPQIGFMELANIVTRELDEKTQHLDTDDRGDWRRIEDLRFSCMNVLLACAKDMEVEPFASMDVPPYDPDMSSNWQAFQYDLEHYIAQIVLRNSTRNRTNSVGILPNTKEQIRSYIRALRDCVENGNMDSKKREALLSRLEALEKELEKRRMSMLAVARIAYHLWAVPGSMWASADIANKLISNVMQTVAEAKSEEEAAKQLPGPSVQKALVAPRKPAPEPAQWGDVEDDIPF